MNSFYADQVMTISQDNLDNLARLAHLDFADNETEQLAKEITAIIDFVDQLQSVDTTQIVPLFHPFDLHQRLRPDEITEEACLAQLAAIAPEFSDDLYLVPQVLEQNK